MNLLLNSIFRLWVLWRFNIKIVCIASGFLHDWINANQRTFEEPISNHVASENKGLQLLKLIVMQLLTGTLLIKVCKDLLVPKFLDICIIQKCLFFHKPKLDENR